TLGPWGDGTIPASGGSGADRRYRRACNGERPMAEEQQGFIGRLWARLTSPSAKWSVLALVVVGLVIGGGGVIATQVMVRVTGTNAFCGSACHSMPWVYAEYKQSGHPGRPRA